MSDFADFEPEDAWDIDDTVPAQLNNLRDRVLLLHLFQREQPPVNTLDDIAAAVQQARDRGDLSPRSRLRADQLDEDIAYLRGRL
jgi:thiamine kinase-like enzyme